MSAPQGEMQAVEELLTVRLNGFSALTDLLATKPASVDGGVGKCIFGGDLPKGVYDISTAQKKVLTSVIFEPMGDGVPRIVQGFVDSVVFSYTIKAIRDGRLYPHDVAWQISEALGGINGLGAIQNGYPITVTRKGACSTRDNLGSRQVRWAGYRFDFNVRSTA